jgi:phenylpropionate dioxygenase-like ring-hydroxylating dioxygenase large terminal subunit
VVVQNCGGVLRAFVNRCVHRHSAIQTEDYGQRRLACPYHGWVYADDGRVKSIPGCERNYGLSRDFVDGLHLDSVALECIGNLIFINLDERPLPIGEQFHAPFLDRLRQVSEFMDSQALFASFRGRYNWKLNFENVVDWNHVAFVHASSFAPLMPSLRAAQASTPERASPPVSDALIAGDLRDLSYEASSPFAFRHWPWHDLVDRFVDEDRYFNFFLYPNVNFISMAGAVFLVQQFSPVAPDECLVRLTMSTARKKARIAATPAILWGHLKSEKRVINEDIRILEHLQRGMSGGSGPVVRGSHEFPLRRAGKGYDLLMSPGRK